MLKDDILQAMRLADGASVSGEELAKKAGVTRTAVWKAVDALKKDGYGFEAIRNKGYRLLNDYDAVTEQSLLSHLPKEYKNFPITLLKITDSTNAEARRILAKESCPTSRMVIAQTQTMGRGRMGRTFYSERGGLYLSLVYVPLKKAAQPPNVTVAAACAAAQAIESVCGVTTQIKWVNDVLVNGKKVCGILSEGITSIEGDYLESLIIGVGINLGAPSFPIELQNTATALPDQSGRKSLLAAEFIAALLPMLSGKDTAFVNAYNARLTCLNYECEFLVQGKTFRGTVQGIASRGGLSVLKDDGTVTYITGSDALVKVLKK